MAEVHRAKNMHEPARTPARASKQRSTGLVPVLALALGAVLAGGTAIWVRSRSREAPLDERTRDRLRPRTPPHGTPSAADIKVN